MIKREVMVVLFAGLFVCAGSAVGAGFWDKVKEGAEKAAKKAKRSRARSERPVSEKGVAAVRGLSEDEGAAGPSSARDYAGLDWIEKFVVAEKEVDRFIREGRLKK